MNSKPFVLQRFLFAGLRKLSRMYPLKNEALKKARVAPATFQCAKCKKTYERSGVNVDHVEPVIDPKVGFKDWDTYINRLFCPLEGLQVLCGPCHDEKTKEENIERRKRSAAAKRPKRSPK